LRATPCASGGGSVLRSSGHSCDAAVECLADGFEGAEASRPDGLPVPPNADKRFEEMDGG